MKVSEGGSDMSQGQRQLLCLARALLRRAKILVLDEATGSVDVETDAVVQATLREAFPAATILTIAHRLHTIINASRSSSTPRRKRGNEKEEGSALLRVVVLEGGRIVECDTPQALLGNVKSRFAAMCKEAGLLKET